MVGTACVLLTVPSGLSGATARDQNAERLACRGRGEIPTVEVVRNSRRCDLYVQRRHARHVNR